MRHVGRWVYRHPYRDPLFQPWLEEKAIIDFGALDGVKTEQTMKLFDWTVRNISLEGDAKDIEALPRDPLPPLTDLGMGYRALPWQTLMFGRGDALQRARVFTQLLFNKISRPR